MKQAITPVASQNPNIDVAHIGRFHTTSI